MPGMQGRGAKRGVAERTKCFLPSHSWYLHLLGFACVPRSPPLPPSSPRSPPMHKNPPDKTAARFHTQSTGSHTAAGSPAPADAARRSSGKIVPSAGGSASPGGSAHGGAAPWSRARHLALPPTRAGTHGDQVPAHPNPAAPWTPAQRRGPRAPWPPTAQRGSNPGHPPSCKRRRQGKCTIAPHANSSRSALHVPGVLHKRSTGRVQSRGNGTRTRSLEACPGAGRRGRPEHSSRYSSQSLKCIDPVTVSRERGRSIMQSSDREAQCRSSMQPGRSVLSPLAALHRPADVIHRPPPPLLAITPRPALPRSLGPGLRCS